MCRRGRGRVDSLRKPVHNIPRIGDTLYHCAIIFELSWVCVIIIHVLCCIRETLQTAAHVRTRLSIIPQSFYTPLSLTLFLSSARNRIRDASCRKIKKKINNRSTVFSPTEIKSKKSWAVLNRNKFQYRGIFTWFQFNSRSRIYDCDIVQVVQQ